MPLPRQQQNTQSVGVSAPINGIVATGIYVGSSSYAARAEGDIGVENAIWQYNMIAGEYGCRVRPGTRDFATNIPDTGGLDSEVRTVMFYNSVVAGGAQDRIFAVTDLGIYDITAGGDGGAGWVLDLPWVSQGGNAGWCSYVNYTNVVGDHYLLVADEVNGYYIFDGTSWTAGTFTGTPVPLAEDLVQISEWNGRVWLVERNTARAWFLDPLALTGDITPLDVGSRFKDGGHLVQCSTWSVDAGDGMDDKFVMISAAGDVLVWEGIDPTTAADLTLIGRWSVGTVPEGRRVMSDWGGDVIILSTSGVITVAALLEGLTVLNSNKYASKNINQYIRGEMTRTLDNYGWSLQQVPNQGVALITVPQPDSSTRAPIQFCLETTKSAWTMFRDIPMLSMEKYGEQFLFGTFDGRVMLLAGTLDDAGLAGESGKAITFSLLTHYSDLGNAAVWKRPQFIRPYWLGDSNPAYAVQARFDFDLAEILTSPAYGESDASLWDAALWDQGLWEGTAQSYLETIGLSGMGRHLAIAIRGTATAELTYIGADVMFDSGGML